jgi:uncharacterized protein
MAPPPPQTLLFFLVTLGFTGLLQLPAALATRGLLPGPPDPWMLPAMLGTFGPLVGAIVATRAERGSVRDLFRSFLPTARGAALYPFALLVPGLLYAVAAGLYLAAGGEGVKVWYLPDNAQRIVALFMIPVVEEIGWRGFAQHRMQAMHGRVRGTLLLGALWAVWHVPMFMIAGVPAVGYALALPFFMAGSVVFAWFLNRPNGALFCALLLHMGAHLNNSHIALPGNLTPFVLHTAAYVVAAVALVLIDRRTWQDA